MPGILDLLAQGAPPQGILGNLQQPPSRGAMNFTDAAGTAARGIWDSMLGLPQRAMQAAGDLQRTGDVYDPRPAIETALMTMGATPFSAPAGALGAGMVPSKGIRAYHGSPHDFERFDLSKIGTGEGAQAYGHGLYFAEAEPTALQYRNKLSKGAGRMYEVNISAKPEQFLDWDKPLRGQPSILEAAKSMGPDVARRLMREQYAPGKQFSDIVANEAMQLGQATDANISAAMRDAGIPGIKYADQGSRFAATNQIPHLQNQIGQLEQGLRSALPSEAANIQRALDQRRNELAAAAQNTTSNYVVFDDKLIDILRKYGLAGMALPPVVAASMIPQDQMQ